MNSIFISTPALTYVNLTRRFERILQATMREIESWELFQPQRMPPLVQLDQLAPDVVMMDLTTHNWQRRCVLIQQIHGVLPHTQVVVIADEAKPQRIFQALQSGAIGYLTPKRMAADLVWVIENARQERGILDAALAHLILSQPQPRDFLDHERAILTSFAEGRTMQEVEVHLDIPGEFLQRHIGNILLKVMLPSADGIVEEALDSIESYHEQQTYSSVAPPSQKESRTWEGARILLHRCRAYLDPLFLRSMEVRRHLVVSTFVKRAASHIWIF